MLPSNVRGCLHGVHGLYLLFHSLNIPKICPRASTTYPLRFQTPLFPPGIRGNGNLCHEPNIESLSQASLPSEPAPNSPSDPAPRKAPRRIRKRTRFLAATSGNAPT